jgi:ech hydrogenase subunit C
MFRRARQHSVWLFAISTGSCNACDAELRALHAARYGLAQRGIAFASSPRHADILLMTGVLTPRSQQTARRVWEQLAEPRALVAIGDCALTGCVFRSAEDAQTAEGAGGSLPVDVEVPGCPPAPALILEGIEAAIKLLDEGAAQEEAEETTQDEAEETPLPDAKTVPESDDDQLNEVED